MGKLKTEIHGSMEATEMSYKNCLTCKNGSKDEAVVTCQVVPVTLPVNGVLKDMDCDFYENEKVTQ